MKKIIIRLAIALVVVLLLVVVGVGYFLDSIVKKGVETVGPQVTKVDVKLAGVSLSLFSGSGSIKGFVLGNPAGYQTPHALSVASTSVAVSPGSVFSDKVVVKSIRIESPEINYEGNVLTDNLRAILDNVTASAGGGSSTNATPADSGKPGKKLQVDEFIITGAKVNVHLKGLAKAEVPVTLPDIHLKNLGQGPDGITSAELTKAALHELRESVLKNAVNKTVDAAKEAVKKTAGEGLNKAAESLGGLLKKK